MIPNRYLEGGPVPSSRCWLKNVELVTRSSPVITIDGVRARDPPVLRFVRKFSESLVTEKECGRTSGHGGRAELSYYPRRARVADWDFVIAQHSVMPTAPRSLSKMDSLCGRA